MATVRIISDGGPASTKVYVKGDAGWEEMQGVQAVTWEIDAHRRALAQISVVDVGIHAIAETGAEPVCAVCPHVASAHRVGDDDGAPGPCRLCRCVEFTEREEAA